MRNMCVGCKHYGMWENEVECGYNSPCTNCIRRMNDNYNQVLPSAQPERNTGRWIKRINVNYSPFDNSGEYIAICPKCGYSVNLEDGGIYNFCSACGADLRGEKNADR